MITQEHAPATDWTGTRPRLSPVAVTAFGTLFATGIAEGAVRYARRPPGTEHHVAGTNAIAIHVLLAIAAMITVIGVQVRRSRQPRASRGPSPWVAPFRTAAMGRLRRTVRSAGRLPLTNQVRAIAAVPLILVLLYAPFRMGAQVTGGLDPNATVNA